MSESTRTVATTSSCSRSSGTSRSSSRTWSGFSNFAISFSIISILAGCFTTFYQGWNNGGPVAISWGWPMISAFILIIGFTMSELVSAYPTSGGIYWWAAKMGGPAAGFFTGWLNLIGLLAVTASVAYGAATFLDLTLSTISSGWADGYSLTRVFLIFVVILVLAAVMNIFRSHLLAVVNNISVWWHVAGAAIVILILIFVPDTHQSVNFVFTERINNSGFSNNSYWFLVLPLGFLLTQYTITGFDASAHLSEETHDAAARRREGHLALDLLLRHRRLRAAARVRLRGAGPRQGVTRAAARVDVIFTQALPEGWHFLVLLISTAGQLFCTTACLTSASRMTFAFSRDGAIPGSSWLSKVNPSTRIPVNAVMFVTAIGIIITLPALKSIGGVPVAFLAVVSVAVIGLYLAFLIPIFLRWQMGDAFEAGSWSTGRSTSG